MSDIIYKNATDFIDQLKSLADVKRSLVAQNKDLNERIDSFAEAFEVDKPTVNQLIKGMLDESLDEVAESLAAKHELVEFVGGKLKE